MSEVVKPTNPSFSNTGDWIASLGDFQEVVEKSLQCMEKRDILGRIWRHDYTVWKNDPSDIANRLGWLHCPEVMDKVIPELSAFTNDVRSAGFTNAILCGMGGSSLAPEVYRYTFGVKAGYINLTILDSTDPGAVLEIARRINPKSTLFIISTKSGGTVETASFMKFFYNQTSNNVGNHEVGDHFIAITDPGSSLESTAKALKFRKVFLNDPNIGGRYSALSYFGLVPAALIGMDLKLLLNRAQNIAIHSTMNDNTAERLGVTMGELARVGRDKITLITSPSLKYFGAWAEQLIAESTGKEGKGILPIAGETIVKADCYANDRFFVYLRLEGEDKYDESVKTLANYGHPIVQLNLHDKYDIGGEFFLWEMATAIAAHRIRINPFDQPNVESAKNRAREMVASYRSKGTLPELIPSLHFDGIKVYSDCAANSLEETFRNFLSLASPGENTGLGRSYVAIQAYLRPSSETDEALQGLRTTIQTKYRMAVTTGYGPRFLHSTGQLHKGDGGHGLFIQITADMTEDVPIPDEPGSSSSSMTFGILKSAQALGDRQALLDGGRQVIRFHLTENIPSGLKKLNDLLP